MAAELVLPKTRRNTKPAIYVVREAAYKSLLRAVAFYLKVASVALLVAGLIAAALIYNSYREYALVLDQQIAGGYLRGHAGLYAAARIIEKGSRVSRQQLATSLQRAGYVRDKASNIWSGSFQEHDNRLRILPREATQVHQWIDVNFDQQGRITSLISNQGINLASFALEPELLTVDAGLKTGQQEMLTYGDIPPVLVQAILAIEDKRFFDHNGLDLRGISRAFLTWSTSGSMKFQQGGSTITQQLVKNTYLTPEKTLKRKFSEALIAVALEQRLSKQDIFALYCNEVYLGQRNGVGVRGVAQAARVFFGKELKDISLSEAATIAGMIQSPARYAPDRHPEAARERRDKVIAAMSRNGAIDLETAQRETAEPVSVAAFESSASELAPYYVDAVNRAVEASSLSLDPEMERSIRVQTTIDPDLQTAAENALRRQLDLLGKSSRRKELPQAALVAIDVHTGHVLAMVGGRSYAESQLNRATDAKRQPGSVFKPFVYATAFESGISPLSVYRDEPQTFNYDRTDYSPSNYGKSYAMHEVLLRDALVRSLNVVTVDLALRTGLTRIASTAADFGLPRPQGYPSMALGAAEATPLQLAAAYAAFANGGTRIEPTFVVGAVDNSGNEVFSESPKQHQVIKPATAFVITDILSDVIKRGTARRAKGSFNNVAIAGKTGTSRDGWFVGYTPNLVCAVWIGFDDNQQLGLTGAEAALPAWTEFMKEAIDIRPSLGGAAFPKPAGIVKVRIDPETGELAGPNCPTSVTINVPSWFAPRAECFKHMPEVYFYEEASEIDLEGLKDTSEPGTESQSLETQESIDSTTLPSEPVERDLQPEKEVKATNPRATETELIERGSRLVVAPTVVIERKTAKPLKPRP